ncbi:MAG: hypothetical protein WBD22_08005 [Pyrinomonadaceae bacterium]
MANKFDTNPLDPKFPEKAKAAAATGNTDRAPTVSFPKNRFETGQFAPPSITEEETRRFGSADFNAYAYGQPQPATLYQAPSVDVGQTSNRSVAKIGLPENILTALPYLPFTIGLVVGLVELFLVPRSEAKVRFHAAQGLDAHIGILIVTTILGVIGEVTDLASFGSGIFTIVTTIMLIIFAVKAWKGKPVHIESVDDLTNWLDEKISPRV